MGFTQAISSGLSNYATFRGRSSRSAFWWFYLFNFLVSLGAAIIGSLVSETAGEVLHLLVTLVFLVPNIAIAARRLHDIGRSGWWQLLAVTLIGLLVLIYWWAQPSQPGPNAYGAGPDLV